MYGPILKAFSVPRRSTRSAKSPMVVYPKLSTSRGESRSICRWAGYGGCEHWEPPVDGWRLTVVGGQFSDNQNRESPTCYSLHRIVRRAALAALAVLASAAAVPAQRPPVPT